MTTFRLRAEGFDLRLRVQYRCGGDTAECCLQNQELPWTLWAMPRQRVADLKHEMRKCGIDDRGHKAELSVRLQKHCVKLRTKAAASCCIRVPLHKRRSLLHIGVRIATIESYNVTKTCSNYSGPTLPLAPFNTHARPYVQSPELRMYHTPKV